MTNAAQFIRAHEDEILRQWFDAASRVASARGLNRPEFTNIMPKFLSALGKATDDLGTFAGARRKYLETHLASRIRQGFSVEEISAELALLGTVAERVAQDAKDERPSAAELEPLWTELNRATATATDIFARHMLEDEQTEKHYLLRLRTLDAATVREGAPPLRDRLDQVVALIKEAVGVDSVSLMLYDAGARELVSVASVGIADARAYATSLDLSTFAGQVAASEELVHLRDVPTTRVEIPPALRQSGIRSILGMRLPERETLTGVLYVGVCEQRSFTAREAARLEVLGEQLALHLDNAALIERLHANIAELEDERELRERFVSVLAHDLRGPLSGAKMAASMLLGESSTSTNLVRMIDRNIDRTDRMVRDLLDANRIHAGEMLPLELADCDLVAVARQVVEELGAIHGPRFVLAGDREVRGTWAADELLRSLWNLGSNAVKYGAPDAPITVSAVATPEHAEMSVHNEGSPIPPEELDSLFRPFVRSPSAHRSRAKGWGLGLTLVRGAAEAHGGRVRVESDAASGTTFTVELPYRPRS